jgi:hypothetical protein
VIGGWDGTSKPVTSNDVNAYLREISGGDFAVVAHVFLLEPGINGAERQLVPVVMEPKCLKTVTRRYGTR